MPLSGIDRCVTFAHLLQSTRRVIFKRALADALLGKGQKIRGVPITASAPRMLYTVSNVRVDDVAYPIS